MIKQVYRKMTSVQIVTAMTITLCLLIDSIVIGRCLGVDAMSAYGLSNPVLIVFSAMGTMAACGVQVLTGEVMGRGDERGCSVVYSTSIVLSLIVAALWMAVVFAATRPLCMLLGAGGSAGAGHIMEMAGSYLRGYMLGAPFFFLSQIMVPFLQVMGKQKLTLVTVAAMTVCDVVFDLLSVYVFHAGLFGIGLASGLSYLAAMLAGIGYFLRRDCMFRFDPGAVSVKAAAGISRAGSPIIINQAGFTIRTYVINQLLLLTSGTSAVAAYSVFATVGNIIYSIGIGAGGVTLLLTSIYYSEKDRGSLYDLIRAMIPYSFSLIIFAVGIVELTAPWLVRLFLGSDPDILSIGVKGMRIYMLCQISCVLITVLKNYYQGIGHMRFTNLISVCDNVIIMIPTVILFSRLLGLTGVWIGIVAGDTLALMVIPLVVWIRYGRISFSTEAFSMLDKSFGADPSHVLKISISDMESAISASERIREFCSSGGLGKRVSMLVSLCVEEMTINIVNYGFTEERTYHADVRVVTDPEKCIVRLRDDCAGFDPMKHFEKHRNDDTSEHIGIRIVLGMADDVNYSNLLGLNNLYMDFKYR